MSDAGTANHGGAPVSAPALSADGEAGLRAALAELADAGTRRYYDAAADAAEADRYYAGVALEELAALVTRTHRGRPRYQPATELYPWVDLHPDGVLRSLYTGHGYDPAELIAADFRTAELRRAEEVRLAAVLGAEVSDGVVGEALERSLPYNCEHVVPQSWFARAEPMRGDLHHLFACEARCNSFRGNTPYAEFADFPQREEAVRTECGKSAADGFEPAHGKGAAARAVFYFCLRYPTTISAAELPPDRVAVLLGWHDADPVSEWERHRNAAIYGRQGNRNPFIDHPDWAADLTPHLLPTPA
jgi:endonuclease G